MNSKVRVRKYGNKSTISIKTRKVDGKRGSFEYEIPNSDASELIENHCGIYILEKTRHYVKCGNFTWEIDQYDGLLEGMTIAEVEVKSLDQDLTLPNWVIKEVTGDPHYKKINMLIRTYRSKYAKVNFINEFNSSHDGWDALSSTTLFQDENNYEEARKSFNQLEQLLKLKKLTK